VRRLVVRVLSTYNLLHTVLPPLNVALMMIWLGCITQVIVVISVRDAAN
jgi:hypothetical protein